MVSCVSLAPGPLLSGICSFDEGAWVHQALLWVPQPINFSVHARRAPGAFPHRRRDHITAHLSCCFPLHHWKIRWFQSYTGGLPPITKHCWMPPSWDTILNWTFWPGNSEMIAVIISTSANGKLQLDLLCTWLHNFVKVWQQNLMENQDPVSHLILNHQEHSYQNLIQNSHLIKTKMIYCQLGLCKHIDIRICTICWWRYQYYVMHIYYQGSTQQVVF